MSVTSWSYQSEFCASVVFIDGSLMQTESAPLPAMRTPERSCTALRNRYVPGRICTVPPPKPGDIIDGRLDDAVIRAHESAFSGPTVILMRCSQSGSIGSPEVARGRVTRGA